MLSAFIIKTMSELSVKMQLVCLVLWKGAAVSILERSVAEMPMCPAPFALPLGGDGAARSHNLSHLHSSWRPGCAGLGARS